MRNRTRRFGMMGMGLAVALTTAGMVRAEGSAEPTTAELLQQINALKAKVESLEQKSVTQADVDATFKQVLADAEKRSQLLQAEGFTAGYSNGKFLLQSADGKFSLNPYLQFQARHSTTWREDGKSTSTGGSDSDDTQNGWELRRFKFGLRGNAISPDLTYNFLWQTDRKTGSLVLEQAFVQYYFAPEWGFRIGQYKEPLNKESLTSSTRLLANERSPLSTLVFGNDAYTQGVSILYGKDGPIHAEAAYIDGFTQLNTNFQDPLTPGNALSQNTADFGFAGRVEWKAFGDWKANEEFTSLGTKHDTLVFGVGADTSQAGDATSYRHAVDGLYKLTNGLSLFAEFGGNYVTNSPVGTDTDDIYTWGAVAQVAYLTPGNKWEPFARYTFINFDDSTVSGGLNNQMSEILLGVNYYFSGQNAKFTLDIGYLPNGSPVNEDGSGILTNGGNEAFIRGQFQLPFVIT